MGKGRIVSIFAFLIIFVSGITTSYFIIKPVKGLKIYKPSDLNPKLVDDSLRTKKGAHTIAPFSLCNQEGKLVTEKDLDAKIYVADFFFTTCPSICPTMSRQMARIYEEFKNDESIMLLSHSVMPEVDSVPILKEYALRYGVDSDSKWMFLTGDKKEIYTLARQSYFAVITEGNGDEHDFIHTENFILVDKKKRIRGFYDGTDEKDVNRLIEEIEVLLEE